MSNTPDPNTGLSNIGQHTPLPATNPTTFQTNNTTGPNEIILTERFLSDPTWPPDLVLSLDKSNWVKWDRCLTLLVKGQGFSTWLNGKLAQPNAISHPKAHWIWTNNDTSLRVFILRHISTIEYEYLGPLARNGSAHAVYTQLKDRHEKLSLYSQILLLKKGLETHF
jgi:hypothetical protein